MDGSTDWSSKPRARVCVCASTCRGTEEYCGVSVCVCVSVCRGTEEYCSVEGKVDIINSTLGKALGGAAGQWFIAVDV